MTGQEGSLFAAWTRGGLGGPVKPAHNKFERSGASRPLFRGVAGGQDLMRVETHNEINNLW
jgi:hypothetical protein